ENIKIRKDIRRSPQEENEKIAAPYITLIASDVTNQTKVEFPFMAKDYWENPDAVNPAEFVRASMSIPVFFEPYVLKVNQDLINKNNSVHKSQLVADQYNNLQNASQRSFYT